MKISFALGWHRGNTLKGAFKSKPCGELFLDYLTRISRFSGCSAQGMSDRQLLQRSPRTSLWLCHPASRSRLLSSTDLAWELDRELTSGISELVIAIGPPDGFTAADLETLSPKLLWSFGPLTFPHELAAVVASEQLYRAWSILKKLPYHLGH